MPRFVREATTTERPCEVESLVDNMKFALRLKNKMLMSILSEGINVAF